jgi:RNA polymerase sigma factor (sigma-70 family)
LRAVYFDERAQYLMAVLTPFDHWFAEQILPHEVALTRYLNRAWPNPSEIPDLRQDIYVRVYEASKYSRPDSPRAFLFATARNLLSDHFRRHGVVSIESTGDPARFDALVNDVSPEREVNAKQEIHRLALAFDTLSDKCRRIVWLRRIEGLSQRQTAERLGLREVAVESQLARGMRALTRAMYGTPEEDGSSGKSPQSGVDDDE